MWPPSQLDASAVHVPQQLVNHGVAVSVFPNKRRKKADLDSNSTYLQHSVPCSNEKSLQPTHHSSVGTQLAQVNAHSLIVDSCSQHTRKHSGSFQNSAAIRCKILAPTVRAIWLEDRIDSGSSIIAQHQALCAPTEPAKVTTAVQTASDEQACSVPRQCIRQGVGFSGSPNKRHKKVCGNSQSPGQQQTAASPAHQIQCPTQLAAQSTQPTQIDAVSPTQPTGQQAADSTPNQCTQDQQQSASQARAGRPPAAPDPGPPDSQPLVQQAARGTPYIGCIDLVSWNVNSVCPDMNCPFSEPKKNELRLLSSRHDIICLQETKTDSAKCQSVKTIGPDHTYFWNHSTSSQGGVAIIVKKAFMDQFVTVQPNEVERGRVLQVSFRGDFGSLDVISTYLSTGDNAKEERAIQLRRTAHACAPAARVCTILAGDFNFTQDDGDRMVLEGARSNRSAAERHSKMVWDEVRIVPQLREAEQPSWTCFRKAQNTVSKIDFVYTNHHPAEDHFSELVVCRVLDMKMELSDHKQILLRRRPTAMPRAHRLAPHLCSSQDWNERIQGYLDRFSSREDSSDAWVKLRHHKQAMVCVADDLRVLGFNPPCTTTYSKCQAAVSFLRYMRLGMFHDALRKIRCHPHLERFCISASLGKPTGLIHTQDLKTYISDVANQAAQERSESLSSVDTARLHPVAAQNKKKSVEAKLGKLRNGTSSSVHCVRNSEGDLVTENREIAIVLGSYWSNTRSQSSRLILGQCGHWGIHSSARLDFVPGHAARIRPGRGRRSHQIHEQQLPRSGWHSVRCLLCLRSGPRSHRSSAESDLQRRYRHRLTLGLQQGPHVLPS